MKVIIEEVKDDINVNTLFVPKEKIADLLLDLRVLIKNYVENE